MPRIRAWGMTVLGLGCLLVGSVLCGCHSSSNNNNTPTGMVYAGTNSATGNAVVAFRRAGDGTLSVLNTYPTGGIGTGVTGVVTPGTGIDPLSSQGSLILSRDGRFLFIVNAGSGTISSVLVANDGTLTSVDTESSGGAQPTSLANFGDLLYVANVGNAGNGFASNVTGFRISGNGAFAQLAGSTRALSTATAQPSCLNFTNNGAFLVVSELSTNAITVFPVNADGTLGTPVTTPSSGASPFGSAALINGPVLVTETSGALSSYSIGAGGALTPISASVANGQAATCWVAVTPNQLFAYTANAGSNSISLYTIAANGALTLNQAAASTTEGTGSAPIDMGISSDGRFLYVLDDGLGAITTLQIGSTGALTHLQAVTGALPAPGAQGLAVR